MSGALVAAVDLACVCEVEAGYGWEVFADVGHAGEDGGASADSDVEHLGSIVLAYTFTEFLPESRRGNWFACGGPGTRDRSRARQRI